VLSPAEAQIFNSVQDKERKHQEMTDNMVAEFRDYQNLNKNRLSLINEISPVEFSSENWKLIIRNYIYEKYLS
ncbi:hypothetical protein KKG85_01195, partial [Patescibacteria group bacterium]|nr:hypothetical protein [Patescibacteria group bacterium]